MASSRTLVIGASYSSSLRNASYGVIATSPQMLLEKLRGAAPGQLRCRAVVHGLPLLVDEGVLGVIAEELERFAGGLHRLLEASDQLRRAPVVLVGEMRLKGNLDVGRFRGCLRRNAVEHHARGQLGNLGGADDGHCAAETETGQADLGAVPG